MRRRLAIILLLILTTTALARAQAPPSSTDDEDRPVVQPAEEWQWSQMISGEWIPLEVEWTPGPPAPGQNTIRALPASDVCGNAPSLNLAQTGGDGGETIVNNYTESALDPTLYCAWGDPPSDTGWRTAWYKFTAPTGGVAVVETAPNAAYQDNYDTILAVYSGNCANLSASACSDDANGFLSRVRVQVNAGQTYYVEVADWHLGVNGEAKLNVIAYMTENERLWQEVTSIPLARSRHAAEVVNNELYILGGQTVVDGAAVRTPSVQKYNPGANQWVNLAPMPGPDGFGYSNADSARVNGVIYFPAGWVGDNDSYAGTHWAYDTATNVWTTTVSAPWITPTLPVGYSANVAAPNVNGYYLIGGLIGEPFTVGAEPQNAVFRFRQGFGSFGDSWFTTPPPLTIARYLHTGVQLQTPQDWVCVVGGLTFGNQFTANGECYTSLGQWRLIADTNIKRFGAQSMIGPDGRWYVIGGRDATFQIVEEIEVFNPPANPSDPDDLGSWTMLDGRYNVDAPVRTWSPGGTIGDHMYISGGETAENLVVPVVERLYVPPFYDDWSAYFPLIFNRYNVGDDTFLNARPLTLSVWAYDGFEAPGDLFDVFAIDVTQSGDYVVQLQNIPAGTDYDLLLYTSNKFRAGASTNVGSNNERIDIPLTPGRYYVFVVRAFPTGDPPAGDFRVRVTR